MNKKELQRLAGITESVSENKEMVHEVMKILRPMIDMATRGEGQYIQYRDLINATNILSQLARNMDYEEQMQSESITEDYSLRSSGVTAFCMKDGLVWETDGIPPAPSEIERKQARAGHVDVEIATIKRLAGIIETDINECPPEVQDIRAAAAKDIREELAELAKFMQFIPAKYKDRFDDKLDSIAHHLQDMEEQM